MKHSLKVLTFVLSLVPAAWLGGQIWLIASGQPHALGTDPGKAIVLWNGEWALRFLLITLAVTPVRQVFRWPGAARLRRMLGLFSFFYASLHVLSYLFFLLELRFGELVQEIVRRPYITVGFLAFCGLVPLAATSNRWMMRRLKQRWKRLHSLVYPIAVLAIVHLLWLTRSDYREVFLYSAVLVVLLGYRVVKSGRFRSLIAVGQ